MYFIFHQDFYLSSPIYFSSICQSHEHKRSIRGQHACTSTHIRFFIHEVKRQNTSPRIELWQVKWRFVTETFLTYFESTRFSPARIFNGGRGVNYYGSRNVRKKDPERERSYLVGKYNSRPLS